MELAPLLGIQKGVTAIIGSGGKTTLLRTLADELSGRVLLCTSTHFQGYADLPTVLDPTESALQEALEKSRIVCAAGRSPIGKLVDCGIAYEVLASLADYVLVEADGSAHRPLKAHLAHEPVIPPEAYQTICVTGVSGFGLPIAEAAHRPERFAALAETSMEAPATPENTALVLQKEGLADRYFFNQADTPERWEWALRAAQALNRPAVLGALQKGAYRRC